MRFILTLTVLSFIPFNAFAEDIVAESSITAAKVYSDRATLTRSAKVEIPAGAHTLILKGLPINLYADSLRAEGSAKAEVVFGALTHKRESFQDYIIPREKELNEQIRDLQDSNRVYQAEKKALTVAKTFLENVGKQAQLRENEEIAKMDFNPERWGGAADSLSENVAKNLKSMIALDFKIRDTNEKIQKLQNDLNQLRTGQKQSYEVAIPLEVDKATTLSFDLSYQIPNVGWAPIYDARLNTDTEELELIQYAQVWQRTGEDWSDVKLTLSTAQPSRGAGLPELYTNWLSLYSNVARRQTRDSGFANMASNIASAPMAQMEMLSSADVAEEAAPVEAKKAAFRGAQINAGGYVGEYEITGPATVKADGTQAKLLIGTFETENALEVQIKPQFSIEAFLVSKVKLKSEAPILPGQVNLFRDGAFIGQAYTQMLRQGDESTLSFGVDDNVTVTRNTLKDEKSEAGLITKDNVIERHYVTEVKNLHKKPVKLAVLETVPVSKDEKIRVEILKDVTTPGYQSDVDNVKGVTRWATELKAGQEAAVNLGWKVSWPKGENISGL